jgi:3-phenylpropionate/trans-cinnamate dioxygenase ferredoxin reductase subunit
VSNAVKPGRPTDYLPHLLPSDVLYACGAPAMVDSVKSIAAHFGAVCYADPFLPSTDEVIEKSVLTRAMGWLASSTTRRLDEFTSDRPGNRREPPMQAYRMAEARVRSHYRT